MAGIKEIRTRIASVTNTQKITSAMKMVSAAKLRKAQTNALQMRPYAAKLHEILINLSKGINQQDNIYIKPRDINRVLIVAVASNGGLCGAFNANIAKASIALIKAKYPDNYKDNEIDFIAIGKKVGEQLKSRGYKPLKVIDGIYDNLNLESVSDISNGIIQSYLAGEYDAIEIIYNKFLNAASQEVIFHQFLPIDSVESDDIIHDNKYISDFIFEPSKEEIINEIIPRTLKTHLYQALLESFASEHGARMTAMHKATDNAGSLLRALKIQYNKARQTSITNEILEIVGGANALSS